LLSGCGHCFATTFLCKNTTSNMKWTMVLLALVASTGDTGRVKKAAVAEQALETATKEESMTAPAASAAAEEDSTEEANKDLGPPKIVAVSDITTNSVRLTWTPPPVWSSPDKIIGYKICVGFGEPNNAPQLWSDGDKGSYTGCTVPNSDSAWTEGTTTNGVDTTAVIPHLKGEDIPKYLFVVQAVLQLDHQEPFSEAWGVETQGLVQSVQAAIIQKSAARFRSLTVENARREEVILPEMKNKKPFCALSEEEQVSSKALGLPTILAVSHLGDNMTSVTLTWEPPLVESWSNFNYKIVKYRICVGFGEPNNAPQLWSDGDKGSYTGCTVLNSDSAWTEGTTTNGVDTTAVIPHLKGEDIPKYLFVVQAITACQQGGPFSDAMAAPTSKPESAVPM